MSSSKRSVALLLAGVVFLLSILALHPLFSRGEQLPSRLVFSTGPGGSSAEFPAELRGESAFVVRAGGRRAEFALEGASAARAEKIVGGVVYRNVFEQTDARYFLQGGGVKEELVLRGPGAPRLFSFSAKLEGVEASIEEDGSVSFKDADGRVAYSIPRPFVLGASGEFLQYLDFELEQRASEARISLAVPEQLFLNANYPLVVDPTIILYTNETTSADGHVSLTSPATYTLDNSSATFSLGQDPAMSTNTYRGFLDYNTSTIPSTAEVEQANLTLNVSTLQNCGGNTNITDFTNMSFPSLNFSNTNGGNQNLYAYIGNGTSWTTAINFNTTGEKIVVLGNAAATQLEEQLAQRWFSVGIKGQESCSGFGLSLLKVNATEASPDNTDPYLIILYGTEPPKWQRNSTNSTAAGERVLFSLNWTENRNLSTYIFSFDNGTGSFANDSAVGFTEASNWSNVTKVVSSTVGSVIRWQLYANDTRNNFNSSPIFQFTTTGGGADSTAPNVSEENSPANQLNSSSRSITFNVTGTDNTDLKNASIYHNATGTWHRNTTNNSLTASNNNSWLLVTASNLPEATRSVWIAEVCDNTGNCAQFNANRTFIVDLTAPNVTQANTANNLNASSRSIAFNVSVKDNVQLANASIFHNATGTWHRNSTNSSLTAIHNNTAILVTVSDLPEASRFAWIMESCDVAGNCAQYNSNSTAIVDLTAPNVTQANTVNNLNSSSQSIVFNVSVKDNVQLANASIFHNATGTWHRNSTNSSLTAIHNNTPILVTVSSLPANVSNRFAWIMEACDVAGNCAQYNSNSTAVVDLVAPSVATVNSPADNLNSSSRSITFSVTVNDNVQLANASIFHNATGYWHRNSTNSSLTAIHNNTAILVTVSNLPEANRSVWVMEACDVAGYCAQFNANRTFIVDLTGPLVSFNSPADNLNSSTRSLALNATVSDANGLVNASFFHNATGYWHLNFTNSSPLNGSALNLSLANFPENNRSVWNVQACDNAGNCASASSNRTFIVDLTAPNVTQANTANHLNSSSQSITFNVSVKDNVQLANASIFHNATGTWHRNSTNSSLTAIHNNTPILVTVSSLPANVSNRFVWIMESCDVVGNCAQYNSNSTAVVDLVAPNVAEENSPATRANLTSQSITFNATIVDNVQLANASIFHNATGTWHRNTTNSSLTAVHNNTWIIVTVASLPTNISFVWIFEACDVAGNCNQFNANRSGIIDLAPPTVSALNSLADVANASSRSITFNATAFDNVYLANASVFHNATGTWHRNTTNSSISVNNNSFSLVAVSDLPEASRFVWNVEVCDGTGLCRQFSSNRTAIVDVSAPNVTQANTANHLNSSSQSITFNASVKDNVQLANASIFHNATGTWHRNTTNSSLTVIHNNTPILVTVSSLPANVSNRFVWIMEACDVAGNCAQYNSNSTAVVDLVAPNVAAENSPVDSFNATTRSITFNATIADNIQLANASIFHNATGYWHRNATNSSLTAIHNNTFVLVAVDNLPDGNRTTWIFEACDVAGNCNQFNANRTLLVTVPAVPVVTLNELSNNANTTLSSIVFNYTPTDNSGFVNATLFANFSGSWAVNNSNTTLVVNNTKNNITVSGISDGLFVWNVQACDNSNNCSFASSNNTFRKDTTAPSLSYNSPADNLNSSSQTIVLNVTASDAFAIQNVSFHHNATGYWHLNSTNSSVPNASHVSLSLSNFPENNRSVWNAQACDQIGNCAFLSSNRSFIVDLTAPNVTAVNSPANDLNSSSRSITFNASVKDNVQLANASIFHNATGAWHRNSTNSSLTAIHNNTAILVTVSDLPEASRFAWIMEACDVAGNCAQYNSNSTAIVDLTAPNVTQANTVNNLNASSQSITFNVSAKDNVQLANASIFHNATGTWHRNATNSSLTAIHNNTPILVTVSSLPANVSNRFVWIMEACDVAGNCAQYNSNSTAVVDLVAPNVTEENSPATRANLTSQSITFNATIVDNVQLANASIFHNATGTWHRNTTNSSLTAIHNNTWIIVTVASLPANISFVWIFESCDVAGNCNQFIANRSGIIDLAPPTVSALNSLADVANASSRSITFNATAFDNVYLFNASVFHNATGTWHRNATNSSISVNNNSFSLVAVTDLPEASRFVWNAEVCDGTGLCRQFSSNRTAIVDVSAPNVTQANTANHLNASSQSIVFNASVKDNVQLANASIFHNATGTWHRNATNSSLTAIHNNTPILVTVSSLPANVSGRFAWIMEACDVAGNCAQYNSNSTAVVDLVAPNVTAVNSPANDLNSSSRSITFNASVKDNVQLANASIFHNATGTWHRNSTNSSLTAVHNNTAILVTVSNLPEASRFAWIMESCDVAGNCAQYNSNSTAIVDLTAPTISGNGFPPDSFVSGGQSIVFSYVVSDNVEIENASIFHNATGYWHRNSTNSSLDARHNNTVVNVTLSAIPENNSSVWRLEACDVAGNCAASSNRSVIVDLTAPSVALNEPVNATNATSSTIVFNYTPADNVGYGNATLYANFSGSWAANNSNATLVLNNTKNNLTVEGIPNGFFVWNVLVCDAAGNCAFASYNHTLNISSSGGSGGGGGGGGGSGGGGGGGGGSGFAPARPSQDGDSGGKKQTPTYEERRAVPVPTPISTSTSQRAQVTGIFSALVGEGGLNFDYLLLKNDGAAFVEVLVEVSEELKRLAEIRSLQIRISPGAVARLPLLLKASGVAPGTYSGQFIIKTLQGEKIGEVQARITVLRKGERKLSISLIKKPEKSFGGALEALAVSLSNSGDPTPFNATIAVQLISPNSSVEVLAQTVEFSDRLYFERFIELPEPLPQGSYSLVVSASYFNEASNSLEKVFAESQLQVEVFEPTDSKPSWLPWALNALAALAVLAALVLLALVAKGRLLLSKPRAYSYLKNNFAQPRRPLLEMFGSRFKLPSLPALSLPASVAFRKKPKFPTTPSIGLPDLPASVAALVQESLEQENKFLEGVESGVGKLPRGFLDAVSGFAASAGKSARELPQGFFDAGSKLVGGVKDFVRGVESGVGKLPQGFFDAVSGFAASAGKSARKLSQGFFDAGSKLAAGVDKGLMERPAEFLGGGKKLAPSFGKSLSEGAQQGLEGGSKFLQQAEGGVEKLSRKFLEGASGLAAGAGKSLRKLPAGFLEGERKIAQGVEKAIEKLPGEFVQASRSEVGHAVTSAKKIVSGLSPKALGTTYSAANEKLGGLFSANGLQAGAPSEKKSLEALEPGKQAAMEDVAGVQLFKKKVEQAFSSLNVPEESFSNKAALDAIKKLGFLVSDARQMNLDERVLAEAEQMREVAIEFEKRGDFKQSIAWSRQALQKILRKL